MTYLNDFFKAFVRLFIVFLSMFYMSLIIQFGIAAFQLLKGSLPAFFFGLFSVAVLSVLWSVRKHIQGFLEREM